METGICRRYACNWVTPCINEKYGSCWWIDKNRTLCSHCYYSWNGDTEMSLYNLPEEI